MQPSAAPPSEAHALVLPPGFRVTVEVDARGDVRICIERAPHERSEQSSAETRSAAVAPALPAQVEEGLKEDGPKRKQPQPATSGLEAATRVAEERGEDALLKFEEWDELLPRRVVRREIKRALTTRALPFKSKGTGRDGRAKMISAGDMIRYFTQTEGGQ